MRILSDEHPDTLTTMHNLASIYWDQGRTAEAAGIQEEVLQNCRRVLGDEHPGTLATMYNLATTYWRQGREAEAAGIQEKVLENNPTPASGIVELQESRKHLFWMWM